MSLDDNSIRHWQEKYRAGIFNDKDYDTQRAAGWFNPLCRVGALAGRLKMIAPVIMGVKEPFILDNYTVLLLNDTGRGNLIYDRIWFQPLDGETGRIESFRVDCGNPDEENRLTLYTERSGFHVPEFGCRRARDMVQYITGMAREMERELYGLCPDDTDKPQNISAKNKNYPKKKKLEVER